MSKQWKELLATEAGFDAVENGCPEDECFTRRILSQVQIRLNPNSSVENGRATCFRLAATAPDLSLWGCFLKRHRRFKCACLATKSPPQTRHKKIRSSGGGADILIGMGLSRVKPEKRLAHPAPIRRRKPLIYADPALKIMIKMTDPCASVCIRG